MLQESRQFNYSSSSLKKVRKFSLSRECKFFSHPVHASTLSHT